MPIPLSELEILAQQLKGYLPGDFIFRISLLDGLFAVFGLHGERDEPLACLAGFLPCTDPVFLPFDIQGAGEVRMRFLFLAVIVKNCAAVRVVVVFTHLLCFFVWFL